MNYLTRFAIVSYLSLLNLYPRRFRGEAVYRPSEASSRLMVYSGLAIILIGAILLSILSWTQNRLLSIALMLVPLALPLVVMFTTYFGNYVVPAGFSFEILKLARIYRYLIFLAGALWLVMSGWTVTRLYNMPPQIEETA